MRALRLDGGKNAGTGSGQTGFSRTQPRAPPSAGGHLEFEEAGRLRDEIRRLEADELGLPDAQKRAPVAGHSNEGKPGTRKTRFGKTHRKWQGGGEEALVHSYFENYAGCGKIAK